MSLFFGCTRNLRSNAPFRFSQHAFVDLVGGTEWQQLDEWSQQSWKNWEESIEDGTRYYTYDGVGPFDLQKQLMSWMSPDGRPSLINQLRPLKLSLGFILLLALFALRSLQKPFYPCSVSRSTVRIGLTIPPLLHRGVSRSSH